MLCAIWHGSPSAISGWHCVSEPLLSPASAVIAKGNPVVCGNGLAAYPDSFARLGERQRLPEVMPHAEAIALLAVAIVHQQQLLEPRDAQPLYLRNKVALTTAERVAAAATAAAASASVTNRVSTAAPSGADASATGVEMASPAGAKA